jgi:hypothetical protein
LISPAAITKISMIQKAQTLIDTVEAMSGAGYARTVDAGR